MNAQEETYKLLAEKLFSYFDSKKFVDWAVQLILNGYDSESLVILAGLDTESTEEREQYFWKSIDELKLNVNKTDFELIDNYAIHIAELVIANSISPEEGLSIMVQIVIATDYSEKYFQFYKIDDDLDYLKLGNRTLFNTGLSLKNADKFIIKEFELFLETEKYQIDDRIKESSFCKECNSILKPELQQKRNFIGQLKNNVWVCANCKSKNILHYDSQEGKETILKAIKTQPNKPQ